MGVNRLLGLKGNRSWALASPPEADHHGLKLISEVKPGTTAGKPDFASSLPRPVMSRTEAAPGHPCELSLSLGTVKPSTGRRPGGVSR